MNIASPSEDSIFKIVILAIKVSENAFLLACQFLYMLAHEPWLLSGRGCMKRDSPKISLQEDHNHLSFSFLMGIVAFFLFVGAISRTQDLTISLRFSSLLHSPLKQLRIVAHRYVIVHSPHKQQCPSDQQFGGPMWMQLTTLSC